MRSQGQRERSQVMAPRTREGRPPRAAGSTHRETIAPLARTDPGPVRPLAVTGEYIAALALRQSARTTQREDVPMVPAEPLIPQQPRLPPCFLQVETPKSA